MCSWRRANQAFYHSSVSRPVACDCSNCHSTLPRTAMITRRENSNILWLLYIWTNNKAIVIESRILFVLEVRKRKYVHIRELELCSNFLHSFALFSYWLIDRDGQRSIDGDFELRAYFSLIFSLCTLFQESFKNVLSWFYSDILRVLGMDSTLLLLLLTGKFIKYRASCQVIWKKRRRWLKSLT